LPADMAELISALAAHADGGEETDRN
jgi:hypothetical protein